MTAPGAAPGLDDLLREGVDANFVGDLDAADEVWVRVREQYPGHPAVPIFEISTIFWRQTFDESNRQYDPAIETRVDEAIEICRARLEANEADAEAHYYMGQALMHRGRLEVVRENIVAAGSAGEKARVHLERTLELQPQWTDPKHPLGMYYFYASVLPRVFKYFSWLWFIPKGDGPLGLAYLEDVREHGDLNRYDASFILLNIHTYLAPDHERALTLARDLHQKFPDNTLLHFEVIEVLSAMEDWSEVIAEAKRLEAHPGRNFHDAGRIRMARVWRAGAELELGHPDQAWETLSVFSAEGPAEPSWASAWIGLNRGRALDALGRRADALAEYKRVVALEPPRKSVRAAALAKEAIDEPYRLAGLPGVSSGSD
jgi:tetratricopeptide (TPR) repeat protein